MVEQENEQAVKVPDVETWIESQEFTTTADIEIPEKLSDQVIGQESAVESIILSDFSASKDKVFSIIKAVS